MRLSGGTMNILKITFQFLRKYAVFIFYVIKFEKSEKGYHTVKNIRLKMNEYKKEIIFLRKVSKWAQSKFGNQISEKSQVGYEQLSYMTLILMHCDITFQEK